MYNLLRGVAMYKSTNEYYKEKYGSKVYKLSIDGGFTCPNRDGTVGDRGCIFCSECGSGEFAERGDNIALLLKKAKKRVEAKNKGGKYIAYFQSYSNTYGSIDKLKKVFYEAIKPDFIVGINIATRPDCLENEKIELLSALNKIKPVTVELGLQTINDEVAQYIRRGYKNEIYFDAVKRLQKSGIEVITHIIIGLPDDNPVNTTLAAVKANTNGVKFHLLHILKGTDLEKEYNKGKVKELSLESYAEILKECISVLPKDTVVHRITGDGAKKDLVAPLWSADKKKTLNYLKEYLQK